MALGDSRSALSVLTPPGLVPYDEAYAWMHDLAAQRSRDEIPDTLILLEHPPVYTAGRRWKAEHLVWAESRMQEAGADLRFIDRGGSVTFHGPRQMVGYPLLAGRDITVAEMEPLVPARFAEVFGRTVVASAAHA